MNLLQALGLIAMGAAFAGEWTNTKRVVFLFGCFILGLGIGNAKADGASIFKENCAICHKVGNERPKAPELKNMRPHEKEQVKRIITRKEQIDQQDHKKNFADKLSEEDLDSVSTYVSERAGK